MMLNEFIRLSPNGQVMKSVRISLRLSCPMNYKKFPFDRQTCAIRLASCEKLNQITSCHSRNYYVCHALIMFIPDGYTTRDLVYIWDRDNPVQRTADGETMPTYRLEKVTPDYCDSITSTGSYSCLRVDLTFKRLFSPYLIHVYIPCTMFVIISWLSFWICHTAVTARTVLGTFLSASGSKNNVNAATGPDDHVGDVEQEIPLKDTNQSDGDKGDQGKTEKITQRARQLAENYLSKFDSLPEKIDAGSRIAFPVCFVLYNLFYWPVYSI
ncbi:Glutamate-gated chloride channel, partial [Orchesella cincta]